jgi:hypothetical protein
MGFYSHIIIKWKEIKLLPSTENDMRKYLWRYDCYNKEKTNSCQLCDIIRLIFDKNRQEIENKVIDSQTDFKEIQKDWSFVQQKTQECKERRKMCPGLSRWDLRCSSCWIGKTQH